MAARASAARSSTARSSRSAPTRCGRAPARELPRRGRAAAHAHRGRGRSAGFAPRRAPTPAASSPPAAPRTARIYVLADESVAGLTPQAWATQGDRAVAPVACRCLVAEVNQGGDMVRGGDPRGRPRRAGDDGARDARQVHARRAGVATLRAGPRATTPARFRRWRTRCATSASTACRRAARPTGSTRWSGRDGADVRREGRAADKGAVTSRRCSKLIGWSRVGRAKRAVTTIAIQITADGVQFQRVPRDISPGAARNKYDRTRPITATMCRGTREKAR